MIGGKMTEPELIQKQCETLREFLQATAQTAKGHQLLDSVGGVRAMSWN